MTTAKMTGQELYDEFKAALEYLGVGFKGMAEVEVFASGTKLRLVAHGRECAINIPETTTEESK